MSSQCPDQILFRDGMYAQTAFQYIGKKDERVAVNFCNCFECLCVTFAIVKIGAAAKVTINGSIPADPKCPMLKKTGAVSLVSEKNNDAARVKQCEAFH